MSRSRAKVEAKQARQARHALAIDGPEPAFYADGADYRCTFCDAILPDGVDVHARYRLGKVIGVRAERTEGAIGGQPQTTVVHSCGTLKAAAGG